MTPLDGEGGGGGEGSGEGESGQDKNDTNAVTNAESAETDAETFVSSEKKDRGGGVGARGGGVHKNFSATLHMLTCEEVGAEGLAVGSKLRLKKKKFDDLASIEFCVGGLDEVPNMKHRTLLKIKSCLLPTPSTELLEVARFGIDKGRRTLQPQKASNKNTNNEISDPQTQRNRGEERLVIFNCKCPRHPDQVAACAFSNLQMLAEWALQLNISQTGGVTTESKHVEFHPADQVDAVCHDSRSCDHWVPYDEYQKKWQQKFKEEIERCGIFVPDHENYVEIYNNLMDQENNKIWKEQKMVRPLPDCICFPKTQKKAGGGKKKARCPKTENKVAAGNRKLGAGGGAQGGVVRSREEGGGGGGEKGKGGGVPSEQKPSANRRREVDGRQGAGVGSCGIGGDGGRGVGGGRVAVYEYLQIVIENVVDSKKTSKLTAMLHEEDPNSEVMRIFRKKGLWVGEGKSARFEDSPDWRALEDVLQSYASQRQPPPAGSEGGRRRKGGGDRSGSSDGVGWDEKRERRDQSEQQTEERGGEVSCDGSRQSGGVAGWKQDTGRRSGVDSDEDKNELCKQDAPTIGYKAERLVPTKTGNSESKWPKLQWQHSFESLSTLSERLSACALRDLSKSVRERTYTSNIDALCLCTSQLRCDLFRNMTQRL